MRIQSVLHHLWVASAAASRVISHPVVHERLEVGELGSWIRVGRVDSKQVLPVRIGLRPSKNALENAENWLAEVSDPSSPKYGKYWTQDEIINAFRPADQSVGEVLKWLDAFRPADQSVGEVLKWLEDNTISADRITHTDNKAWLAFDATAAELESLLKSQFHTYSSTRTKREMIACDMYHIPRHLQEYIDYVMPGVKGVYRSLEALPSSNPQSRLTPKNKTYFMPQNGTELKTCDRSITPACVRALYNFTIPDPKRSVSPNNSLGIFEEGSVFAQLDLDLMWKNFTSIPKGTRPLIRSIDGGVAERPPAEADAESDMDLQLAIPIIYPQTTTLYAVDDPYWVSHGEAPTNGLFNTFLDAIDGSYCTYAAYNEKGNDPILDPKYPDRHNQTGAYKGKLQCGLFKPTNVISISYGEQEIDLPAYYQKRQCNEYLKLGLQGVTIVVASGDTGVAGVADDKSRKNGCLKNWQSTKLATESMQSHIPSSLTYPTIQVFSPTHPNSCPYLTNVGATKVLRGRTVYEPESAANDVSIGYSSSGGFSNLFLTPRYQRAAVASYFKNHNPPYPYYSNGNYNNSNGIYNRNGRGIPDVAANGDNTASYVRGKFFPNGGTSASAPIFAAIVNRVIEERIRIGKGPVGFINPVLYQNPQILNDITNGSNPGCGTNGFSAVKGWDPVTGLGTPNYPKMLELFLSLP